MKAKSLICSLLVVQLIGSSVFAQVTPTVTHERVEQRLQLISVRDMSDEQILDGLKEIETLIAAREEQLNSAAMKNSIRFAKKKRVVALSLIGLSVFGFIKYNKMTYSDASQWIGVGSLLGSILGGVGFVSSLGSDKILANLHDTKMSRDDIDVARFKLEKVKEKITNLRVRIETHLSVQKERAGITR